MASTIPLDKTKNWSHFERENRREGEKRRREEEEEEEEEEKKRSYDQKGMELTLGMDYVWNPRKVYEFQT